MLGKIVSKTIKTRKRAPKKVKPVSTSVAGPMRSLNEEAELLDEWLKTGKDGFKSWKRKTILHWYLIKRTELEDTIIKKYRVDEYSLPRYMDTHGVEWVRAKDVRKIIG